MKKLTALALCAILGLSVMGCGKGQEGAAQQTTDAAADQEEKIYTEAEGDSAADQEEKIYTEAEGDSADAGNASGYGEFTTVEPGKLKIGMEIGYPPMEYLDEDGVTPIGFDVEVSKLIAEKLGLEPELIDTAWDGIFSSLDSDRYDCVMAAVSITDKRKENYNMTKPYLANKVVLVTGVEGINSPEDLEGHSVATQTETTADIYIRGLVEEGLDAEVFPYDQILKAFDELKIGRVDAVLVDSVVANYYIGEDKQDYKIVWEAEEGEPMGIAFKKGNDGLTNAVEKAVDELYAEGTMGEIATKWFGYDTTKGVR